MESKLCRICGRIGERYVHIFRTEGLKGKIETCLPIIVSPHCLLPDTICYECNENVANFYAFIKNCLQSIIVLEAQYDIRESCLKTKRRHDKASSTDSSSVTVDTRPPPVDTDLDADLAVSKERIDAFARHLADVERRISADSRRKIVDYDDSSSDERNDIINEIVERKSLKRKAVDALQGRQAKMFRIDGGGGTSRRKRRPPVKVEYVERPFTFDTLERIYDDLHEGRLDVAVNNQCLNNAQLVEKAVISNLPQVCLLCDMQFTGPSMLAAHVYDTHGIDMAQIVSNEPVPEKRKKIPNLVKITDLKQKRNSDELKSLENGEDPPTLEPSYVCPHCPASLTNKTDLFSHLRQKHPDKSHLMCGLCLYQATSYLNLTDHLETCSRTHVIANPYVCKVCKYSEESQKSLENHILVHDFIITFCKKEGKIFDPSDYVEPNPDCEPTKTHACGECGSTFVSFKEFSTHRRSAHSIFHCDLCSKSYGRNSHLWKHVNRLHKGHPSITCQFCYKTSASKYHLAQHFNKIHTVKSGGKPRNGDADDADADFLSRKFEAFDFQSVRQSFMRQEMERKDDEEDEDDDEEDDENVEVPKEIDTSSNLYTNIITNYTPPANNGEFKCPKCSKGFHKKTLLKKHKKNCRPRLQKDLLTRCKSCSRIFKDRQSLAKHLVNYHSEYVCEICDEKVQSKCEIVSHIRFTHTGCHLFCPDCGNVLRNRDELRLHLDDHSNSFVCQFCADLLPSKIKLKMHILSLHRKILSLSCGVCLKLFETQHILRDHVRLVHRDVLTPLTSCTVCGKNYGSKWKTYDHINKSHGRIFRACKACLEVFDTERDLEAHYESAHVNAPKEKPQKKEMMPTLKKEVYESDQDRDDKNSSSGEESSFEADDGKISLLEKRLTAGPNEPHKPSSPQKKKLPPPPPLMKKPAPPRSEPEYAPDQNGSNSSKRTVYVNSNDPSLCEICLKTWPAKKHLWQHYIRCHKLVAATVCGICLKTNDSYEMLQQHLQATHPTLLHGKGFGSNFICRICGRYHNASSKLKLHMAIHENFDWKLLDNVELKGDEDINYESLIEQVECSSDNDSSSSSDSTEQSTNDVKEESEDESNIKEEIDIKLESVDADDDEDSSSSTVKSEDESSEEDEDDDDEDDDDYPYSENTNETTVKNMNVYAQHPDVVDSAVKSICFEEDEADPEYSNSDYEDVQTHNLNPHEIQSAVDSIL